MLDSKELSREVHEIKANLSEQDFDKVCGESPRPAVDVKTCISSNTYLA